MDAATAPTPRAMAARRPLFDRRRWEAAVLASDVGTSARTVALVLAHHADAGGHLPAGGSRQEAGRLARSARIPSRVVRLALTELEAGGWIARPDMASWEGRSITRPVTLTGPADAPARREPPGPGCPHA